MNSLILFIRIVIDIKKISMSTPQQLKERWKIPEGKEVKQQIIDHSDSDWERYLSASNQIYHSKVIVESILK